MTMSSEPSSHTPVRSLTDVGEGRVCDTFRYATGTDSLHLVYWHGTPGSGLVPAAMLEAAAAHDVPTIALSRAGYGASTRLPGRSVADAARDLGQVLEALDLDEVVVVGWSGGGAHTLASAALLSDRVRAAAVIAGTAPRPSLGDAWIQGMGEANIEEFALADASESDLRAFMERETSEMLQATGLEIVEAMASLLSPADVAVFNEAVGEEMIETMRDGLRNGVDGWVDDDFALLREWGFDLAGIDVPVAVWFGNADLMVPPAHGRWLAENVPGARVHHEPEEGHVSLPVRSAHAIVADLLDLSRP
jgi:pimeloyl-ACP methyl ester carboxylesterase